jgi:two-component system chemotaxis response regulator CheB
MNQRLRLLIVDDSALMRRTLRMIFESDPTICVVGEAANGREVLKLVPELRPDVITMDVRMPLMDGLETTEWLMAYHPTPILVLTASLSSYDIDITFKMLGAGALDIVEKPRFTDPVALERIRHDLVRRVKLLARVRVVTHLRGKRRLEGGEFQIHSEQPQRVAFEPRRVSTQQLPSNIEETSRSVIPRRCESQSKVQASIVVIGASTGGPRVVRQILAGLPSSFGAAILVVQHIAEGFSAGLVEWFASACTLSVALASEGDKLSPGTVFVVPARHDLLVQNDQRIHLNTLPVLLQRPSVDITMQSVAEVYKSQAIGILLTGMGRDGAIGMQSIRRAGGYAIAQHEATCTIYGMPRAAIELNAVDAVLSPEEIIPALQDRIRPVNGNGVV